MTAPVISNVADPPCATIPPASPSAVPLKGNFERMARRRFQDPKPYKRGEWWYLRWWRDDFSGGKATRKRAFAKWPASIPAREIRKIAAELLRPVNQGLESIGSATNFERYVNELYIPNELPTMAKSTQTRYRSVIKNYLLPTFGDLCLRDLMRISIQRYLSSLAASKLSDESRDKIRDVLASILNSAVKNELLVKNPMDGTRLPAKQKGKKPKPYLTPKQFERLIEEIPEPYASMVYVAVYTGLRISELIGLRWDDIHTDSLTIDERCTRGDWGAPKSEASNATIGVNGCVIERIERLKLLTVEVKAGRAVRKYRVVKSDGPNDLVFQSVRDGKPMRENNILSRFIKPAGRMLGIPWVNWRCLRTSHATWLKMAGADLKDAQSQMRHSRASTTSDIYQQFVPESQMRAVERLSTLSSRMVN